MVNNRQHVGQCCVCVCVCKSTTEASREESRFGIAFSTGPGFAAAAGDPAGRKPSRAQRSSPWPTEFTPVNYSL